MDTYQEASLEADRELRERFTQCWAHRAKEYRSQGNLERAHICELCALHSTEVGISQPTYRGYMWDMNNAEELYEHYDLSEVQGK